MNKIKIAVLGGGSWGTALAEILAQAGHDVCIIVRRSDEAEYINREHRNPRYVSDFALSPSITASSDSSVLEECSLVVSAVPCQYMRGVLSSIQHLLMQDSVIVNAAKGIEVQELALPSMIVQQEIPAFFERYATLSGPSFAHEVLTGKPTAVVLGCTNSQLGIELREVFSVGQFRTYSCDDVIGVELGGAIKNVIAIAAGISDGLGFGNNARAALITRGIAEITRLGLAMGARAETFMGLSGLGDLTLTCAGDLSRNRRVGLSLAQGKKLSDIIIELGMVAEGVKTADSVHRIAQAYKVEMPVSEIVYDILYEELEPLNAVSRLFARELKEERV